jgi:hypothetical protein
MTMHIYIEIHLHPSVSINPSIKKEGLTRRPALRRLLWLDNEQLNEVVAPSRLG